MVVDNLYGIGTPRDKAQAENIIDLSAATKAALKSLYKKHSKPSDFVPDELFQGIVMQLNMSVSQGLEDDYPQLAELIKNNNEVFAAFKVHDECSRMAELLTNDKGDIRSFAEWKKLAEPIASHHNKVWLKTEYATAVNRAEQARQWKQFENEKEVLPNLRWIPTTAATPGADHVPFWDTVLPIDNSFWSQHKPGDRWGCQCSLEATDDPTTKVPHGSSHDDPAPGLENNPAKDGKLFSKSHPYYPNNCSTCKFNTGGAPTAPTNKAMDCYSCQYLQNCLPDYVQIKKKYGRQWSVEQTYPNGGHIVIESGHGQDEKPQNIKSATPLARDGKKIELLRQKTIRINGCKKKIISYDANVDGEKWEFKYTSEYVKLDKSIGTKAAQAITQGAKVLLIDIHKTKLFSVKKLIDGIDNSFTYNKSLNSICIMLESEQYNIISREQFERGLHSKEIKKWLESEN